jgi:hypothetical protein
MNFKSLIAVGLGVATLAISLPAHADSATVIQTEQDAVVTGKKNITTQSNNTRVGNYERGNRDNSGTSIGTSQRSDVFGEKNKTSQTNSTAVGNFRIRNK